MIRSIFITGLSILTGWPQLERVTAERGSAGRYHHLAGDQLRRSATVQITLAGAGRCRTPPGPWIPLRPGEALIFDAGRHGTLVYETDPEADHWDFLYFNLDGQTALTMIAGLTERYGHVLPFPPDHALVRRWLAHLPATGATHRAMPAAENAQLAGEILTALAGSAQRAGDEGSRLVDRALAKLSQEWRDPSNATDLARQLGVSREHLVRTFRAVTGIPPARWSRHYRIQRTTDLLVSGTDPVADIASAAGFATVSHFVRTFHAVLGETPAAYRKRRTG